MITDDRSAVCRRMSCTAEYRVLQNAGQHPPEPAGNDRNCDSCDRQHDSANRRLIGQDSGESLFLFVLLSSVLSYIEKTDTHCESQWLNEHRRQVCTFVLASSEIVQFRCSIFNCFGSTFLLLPKLILFNLICL